MLAFAAGAAGLALTRWLVDVLPIVLPLDRRQIVISAEPDARVFLFTLGVTLATGLFIWVSSALQLTRRAATPSLGAVGSGRPAMGRPRVRQGLVAA